MYVQNCTCRLGTVRVQYIALLRTIYVSTPISYNYYNTLYCTSIGLITHGHCENLNSKSESNHTDFLPRWIIFFYIFESVLSTRFHCIFLLGSGSATFYLLR
jgi:hypothetical protein